MLKNQGLVILFLWSVLIDTHSLLISTPISLSRFPIVAGCATLLKHRKRFQ
ncbi:MAG: hypothetical protein KKA79_08730 [Nanoarchaeota archaeon]|nr:hypothetical protein [Nanoarchaeota archaeon]